jgi:hypothetical protein
MLYRIYTENINKHAIEKLVNDFYEGYTIIESTGYWQGKKERSMIIEIITSNPESNETTIINTIATRIKKLNKQQSVLVAKFDCNHWIV